MGAATQWLFNFIIARTVLTMQRTMGQAGYVSCSRSTLPSDESAANGAKQGMFFMFGTFGFLMGIFVWFFVPETKGLSLEKMDELFGVTEMAKQVEEPAAERVTSIREENLNKETKA